MPVLAVGWHNDNVMRRHKFGHCSGSFPGGYNDHIWMGLHKHAYNLTFRLIGASSSDCKSEAWIVNDNIKMQCCKKCINTFLGAESSRKEYPNCLFIIRFSYLRRKARFGERICDVYFLQIP